MGKKRMSEARLELERGFNKLFPAKHPGRSIVVRSGQTYIECPDCGRHDVYSRSKTLDFVCKKCGKVFTRKAAE